MKYINRQLMIINEFVYEQLKKVENNKVHIGEISLNIIVFCRNNNICMGTESILYSGHSFDEYLKLKKDGHYENNIVGVGILSLVNSGLLIDFHDNLKLHLIKINKG